MILDGVPTCAIWGDSPQRGVCRRARIIVPLKNAAPVNADAMKTSAGALNKLPVARVGSIRNTIKALQIEGYSIVAANEKSNTVLFRCDFRVPTVIVMGSEG